MAIIYSYPTVVPTPGDLVLGTDVNGSDKPTKNFTIQSIVDIVAGGATGLGAVLKISSNAQDLTDPANPVNQPIQNLTFINGTGSATFGSFIDGTMTIQNGTGTNFVSIESTDFVGNLTGIVKVGSSIAGAADGVVSNNVTAITQPANTSNTTIATTEFVQQELTGEDLDFRGDDTNVTGSVDLNSETFAIVGKTINAIKNINTDTTAGGTLLNLSLANDVTIADDLTVTDVLTVNGTTASNIIAGGLQVNNSGGAHTFRVKGQTIDNLINTNVGDSDAKDQVAIGKNAAIDGTRLDVAGLIQGTSIKSSGMLTAQAGFTLTGGVNLPVGAYGSVNQVLTNAASPGATTSLVWTTPTVGTLTDVDAGIGIIIDKTAAAEPIVAIRYQDELVNPASGALNFIDAATAGAPVLTDLMVFSDQENISTKTNVKKVTILDILDLDTSVDGTQYTLPVFATQTTLGDSIIKQDSGASAATVTGTLTITSTGTASKFIVDATKADANFRGLASEAKILEIEGDISPVDDVISYPATSGTVKVQSAAGTAVAFQDGASENLSIVYPVQGQVVSGTSIVSGTTVASISGGNLVLNTATSAALVAGATLSFAASVLEIYTSGGGVRMPSFIPSTIATSKYLTNLPTPTSSAITANDTILAGMAKLQGQISALPGALQYKGAWDASNGVGGSPNLQSASFKVNGHFYIVSVDSPAAGTFPNGGSNPPSEWKVGDWCVFTDDGAGGAADVWQKIDNSSQVSGSGALNKVTKWTGPDTIGTGLISDDATVVTIGATGTGNFLVEGTTTLGGSATTNTLISGDLRINKELNLVEGLGAFDGTNFIYGPAVGGIKPVLTSGGSATTPPTWAIPTVGTVEDVALTHYGDAFVVAVTDGSGPDVSIAITKKVGALATDYINGLGNITAFPTLDNYVSWTIEADDANTEAITSGAVVDFVGVGNVSTAWDATSNELRISASENPGTGTALTLPVWEAGGATLGDSMVSQDAAVGTTLTIAGNVGIKGAALVELQVNASSGYAETRLVGASGSGGSLEFYDDTTKLADIYADPAKKLYFRTNGQTTALTLDDGQDATFAGDVKLLDNKILQIGTGNDLELYHNSGSVFSQIRNNTGDLYISNLASDKDIIFQGKDGATAFTALTLGMGETGNATFAGDVIGGSTKTLKSWRRLQTDANNDWGLNNNAGSPVISISAMGTPLTSLTTFAGNVEIDGNLTVDGHIIHGGGGGGTGKGGTFTKLFTTASGATNRAFTIVRGTSGAMVFDVMMTSDTSNACSIAKKFTVVKQFGVDPNVFKIIDTGPDGSNDFTVAFTQHTTDTSIKCIITPVTLGIQTIGITIDLGFGKNDAVVTMNASSA